MPSGGCFRRPGPGGLEALLVVVAPPRPAGVGVAPPHSVGFSMAPPGAGGFFFVDAREARVLAVGGDMVNIKRSNIRAAPEVKNEDRRR